MLQLVMWNSQGAKWDLLWTSFFNPLLAGGPADAAGLLVESGWAPWVSNGDVIINSFYDVDSDATWYNRMSETTSTFVAGVKAHRRRWGMWIPWVAHFNDYNTNSRCSLGGTLNLDKLQLTSMGTFNAAWCRRPILRLSVGKESTTMFSIYVVHLISGYWPNAQKELDGITAAMKQLIPQGTAAIIVGDMKIDLQAVVPVPPQRWAIIRTGGATQQSGGELDWGLLYDPNQQFGATGVVVVQQYKTPPNNSDHSVLRYSIPV
jgi:hypothetical protein